nr:sialin-3 [Pleurobrachia bachei]
MGYVKTSGTALAATTCLLAVYVEMSARFGIPIAMIGGMLKKNCTVDEELCWNEQTKANVLGAYFYGYTAMFFSVSFVKKFNIFLSGYRAWLVLCIAAQFTYPILAQLSTGGLMVAQAVRGFMTGIMITYNMEFINNWIPLRYKKSLISAIGFINYLGNGTAGLIASAFTSNIGWEYYFYFCGAMFSLVLLLNLIFVATFPKDSFFLKTCGQEVDTVQRQEQKQPVKFSFRDILSRWYVWMFCVYGISYNLTYYHTLVTSPFYLNEVLQLVSCFLKLRPQFRNMGYVKTSGLALAAATCLLAVYVEMSARFGIPIAMIGGMLKKNCTVDEELCWNEQTKANVLGAYFYGYTRAWLVLCIAAQFTYPILAQLSTGGLMVAQAVRGFMTGIMITYNMEFINNWIPLRYKKSLISAIGFINYLGNGTAGLIASAFTSNIGWEYYFYFCGAMFSLVLLLNLIFVATFPKDSFFLKTCGQEVDTVQRQEQKQPVKFSFRDILSRWYVWMFCVYGISYNLTYYHTLVTSPFYLNEVLQVDAQTISLITLGLSLTVAFSTIFFSWFFQWLDTYISWRTCRMLFMIFPMVIQIIVFLVFPWIETTGAATFLLILSTLAASTFFSGSVITANMEIDPENAAVVLSLFNGAAQIAGFLGPILMAVFTDIEDKKEGWDKFFYAMAGCAAVGIVSIVFAVWVKPSEWKNRSKLGEPFRVKIPEGFGVLLHR